MSANDKPIGPRWSGRRARAARMLAAGMNIAQVATVLGLSPATARRYESAFVTGGADALMGMGDVGRRSRLSAAELARVIQAIRQSPGKVRLAGECWTNSLVQRFIEREFQICYSYSHINRLIRDHGLQHWIRQDSRPASGISNTVERVRRHGKDEVELDG
ncbi:helix-turn-helix domain-containing protein [Paraburkholderia bannensis]|uniref:helix-turn-helix domain-containing protein n=1 Tax=Paraburkholderia bannensis TaxID=765414 RepID=UPI002AB7BD61|nr:helix-turn-helix domain-containing protein [Paraburkholderia bannensis]